MATVSEPAAAFEGHPFIVEAGVSLGGQAVKDGINVYRFANRIPLLFEAGNDVVTQVRLSNMLGWWESGGKRALALPFVFPVPNRDKQTNQPKHRW